MESLKDYVEWIAISMGLVLDDNQSKRLARWLINNKKYQEVLRELEEMILQVSQSNQDR